MKALVSLIALCAILALAGCGGTDSDSTQSIARPDITVPKGPPPKKLVVKDLREGTGRAVRRGDEVTVQWAGYLYKRDREFYSTWKEHHSTFTFLTGAGRVIPGWDRGMMGMKVGGRRELIIPPALAYGDVGSTSVPPSETLIYVIDLVAIEKP
jgi:peptidylprolyl isomerase